MTIYIPKSDEIDWEFLILKKVYKVNIPNISYELFKSEDIRSVTIIACGLLFFYGKIFLEYLQEKIDV